MNKDFIPHEQALELKELGFDDECVGYYSPDMDGKYYLFTSSTDNTNRMEKYNPKVCPAPLYQQSFRWFRDKKLCDGSVCRHGEADGGYSYRWDIVHEYGVYEERHFKQGYKTYEESELACLNRLIEIVKNK